MVNNNILKVRNLSTHFKTDYGLVKACDDVSFGIEEGKNLGLVGESGCGKTMCCLSILNLIPPEGEIVSGQILFEDKNLLSLSNEEFRNIRGNQISIIFQEPMTSLNPVLTIGEQITESILAHKTMTYKRAGEEALELLNEVKIDDPKMRFKDYPHNLSGGMRQRVMIAMAISCKPKILIADEPTTALDVTIQAKILELLDDLQSGFDMSVLIVSHDFGVIARLSDRIAVMYAGQIVEYADAKELFENSFHPYTQGLLNSIKQIENKDKRLSAIKGTLTQIYDLTEGCKFYPRCDLKDSRCQKETPKLKEVRPGHFVRCLKR